MGDFRFSIFDFRYEWPSRVVWLAIAVLTGVLGCGGSPPPKAASTNKPGLSAENTVKPDTDQPGRGKLRIAAASDLKFALDEIVTGFRQQKPTADVHVTYGASGTFFAQLSNKAPFDLFLSADIDYPRRLIKDGHALADSEFVYAIGRVVIWVRNESPLDLEKLGMQALVDPGVRKVAIANPRHAPYGRAAEAAMKSLGVYDAVAPRLVNGENVAQAAQFVESGAADAGIIALSLALAPEMKKQGRYWQIPADAHPQLEQGGAILEWANDLQLARDFREFLLTGEGREILKRYDFNLPEKTWE